MLFKKLLRTISHYKAQFISMIIMIAIGVGIFLGANMEWYTIKMNRDNFFNKTHYPSYSLVLEDGASQEDVEKVSQIEGVDQASRFLSLNTQVKGSDNIITLAVTEDFENTSFMMIGEGTSYQEDDEEGIWISDQYASLHHLSLNDTFSFSYSSFSFEAKIRGFIKSGWFMVCLPDSSLLMPDYNSYGYAYVTPAFLKAHVGREIYTEIHLFSSLEKDTLSSRVNDALGKTTILLTHDEMTSYAASEGEIEEGKTMGSIMPVLFLAIALLTMVTTMHRLTINEKTQIGILKALGFKNRKIAFHYTSFAIFIGIIGSVLGIALGCGFAYAIMNPKGSMGIYLDLPTWTLYTPWFGYLAIILMNMFLIGVGYLSIRKILKGSASDTLRPYAPKKMKQLAIEKTKLWKKWSFGTKWNLRDIFRHKARTGMTIFGVLGCAILIVGSLGMKDTMNHFVNTFYEKAMNYQMRINLTDEASYEDALRIASLYEGDYSGSTSVMVEEETVGIEVYHVEHDRVRFVDMSSHYVSLENNGVYVCSRISDKFHLKEGSTFTFYPYGTEKSYEVKVIGVLRSLTESIILSEDFAKEIGYSYHISSVYTAATSIQEDVAIKSTQSKESIMKTFDSFMSLMNTMVLILMIAALVLGVVVLYNLGVMSYMERYREMSTLKVVGFKDKKIGKLLTTQNLWLSMLGTLVGVPLGYGVLKYLIKALASEYEMSVAISWMSYLITIILTLGVSLFVSWMIARKNKKIDMVESLKCEE